MTRPYRDSFTITQQPDGTWQAKQHGYPFYFDGATAEECLRNAGRMVDAQKKSADEIMARIEGKFA